MFMRSVTHVVEALEDVLLDRNGTVGDGRRDLGVELLQELGSRVVEDDEALRRDCERD